MAYRLISGWLMRMPYILNPEKNMQRLRFRTAESLWGSRTLVDSVENHVILRGPCAQIKYIAVGLEVALYTWIFGVKGIILFT